MSATFGEPRAAAAWIGQGIRTKLIESTAKRDLRMRLYGFCLPIEDPDASDALVERNRLADKLLSHFKGRNGLIFGSSKRRLEEFADLAKRRIETPWERESIRVHHASLSRVEREDVESDLRSDRTTTVFCSSTLEMGIDVGSVAVVGQLGAPWSAASLTQRLGRSGRLEGQAAELRVYIDVDEADPSAPLPMRLYMELLQAIAICELITRDGWTEPPSRHLLHLSTLIQQILSLIRQTGGASPAFVFKSLCREGAFRSVTPEQFGDLLRCLGDQDILEQISGGDLILGIKGEPLVASHHFYAAFATNEEAKVIHDGQAIGQVDLTPDLAVCGFLILAGRRWKIIDIDIERKVILVVPSRGGRPPMWGSSLGIGVHEKVRKGIRALLMGSEVPRYLDSVAAQLLGEARTTARSYDLGAANVVMEGPRLYWFTWTGTAIHEALVALLQLHLAMDGRLVDHSVAIELSGLTMERFAELLEDILAEPAPRDEMADLFLHRTTEKYDHLLSDELRRQVVLENFLDRSGALELASSALESIRSGGEISKW